MCVCVFVYVCVGIHVRECVRIICAHLVCKCVCVYVPVYINLDIISDNTCIYRTHSLEMFFESVPECSRCSLRSLG